MQKRGTREVEEEESYIQKYEWHYKQLLKRAPRIKRCAPMQIPKRKRFALCVEPGIKQNSSFYSLPLGQDLVS